MMELNRRSQLLPAFINRTCNLYHEIDAKIHYDDGNSSSFCKHCLQQQHGLCCWVAQTPTEERKTLIAAIRDSLKDVQDMLLFIQKSESRGKIHENEALARLEASRFLLIEKINQYPAEKGGRKMEVLEELKSWLGKGNRETAFFTWSWKSKNHEEKKHERKGKNVGGFLYTVSRFGNLLLSPWKWFSTTKKTIRLLIISTIITCSVRFCRRRSRRQFFSPRTLFLLPMNPKMPRKLAFAKNNNINVFSGRG